MFLHNIKFDDRYGVFDTKSREAMEEELYDLLGTYFYGQYRILRSFGVRTHHFCVPSEHLEAAKVIAKRHALTPLTIRELGEV